MIKNHRVLEFINESAEAREVQSDSSAFKRVKKDGRISPVSAELPR